MFNKIMSAGLGTWIAIIAFADSVSFGFLYRCSLNTHTEDLFWRVCLPGFTVLSLFVIYISCLVAEDFRGRTIPKLQGRDHKIFIAASVFVFVTLFLIGSSIMTFILRRVPDSPTHPLTAVILLYLLVNLTIIVPKSIMNCRLTKEISK